MSFCSDLIERVDSDRYVLSLFAGSREQMEALCAVYAFNYEIARIRESVTDTNMGLVRMQWWRDGLRGLNASYTNDIMVELKQVQAKYDIPYQLFDDLMVAREFDLEGVQPSDVNGFYLYAESVEKPLAEMVEKILGVNLSVDLCRAYGVQGLLRAFIGHAKQGRCYLPEGFGGNESPKEMQALVREIVEAQLANLRLCRRESRSSGFGKAMHALSSAYLKRCARFGYELRDERQALPLGMRYLRLLISRAFL